jgi:hypothetical protein
MNIERYINDDGEFRCFVVDNTKVSRNGMTKMVSSIPGAIITKSPRFFDDDVFCEFTYKEKCFIIEEPYGDNTTYDVIAPENGLVAFDEIATFFESATPTKGGDWGYNSMFLLRMVVAGIIFTGIVTWLSS